MRGVLIEDMEIISDTLWSVTIKQSKACFVQVCFRVSKQESVSVVGELGSESTANPGVFILLLSHKSMGNIAGLD